ncbi:MAG: hypothetical protein NC252_04725 [Roseburia sp.]|nr:hypothetical protein [Roseburia sp.]
MKKMLFTAACLVLLASCGQTGKSESESERDSLQNVIAQKDSELDEIMNAYNEIQNGFALINEAEGRINLMNTNAEGNSAVDNIRENMEFIQQTLEENKRKIEELQSRLNASSINAAKIKEAVAKLTEQLNTKNLEIEELRAQLAEKDVQIAQLGDSVSTLVSANKTIQEKSDMNEEIARNQDQQLNTAWYVFGTNRELKDHKILVNGDVLATTDFDKEYFTKIDIRKTTVIPLSSKSAKILTTHPAGSYSLLKDARGEYTLRITDAGRFWSVSKYLVVKVK